MTTKLDKTQFLAELKERAAKDKAMRLNAMEGQPWDATVDEHNTEWIRQIIHAHGWPKISQFGEEALENVWVLVQHADHDPVFQEYCLELMKQMPQDETNRSDMAYLEDRVRVNTGRKQVYGTQFYTSNQGEFKPQPIEDEANLDTRRATMGLGSFKEYSAVMTKLYEQHGQ